MVGGADESGVFHRFHLLSPCLRAESGHPAGMNPERHAPGKRNLAEEIQVVPLPPGPAVGLSMMLPPKDWPHAPVHRMSENGVYIVTAGVLHKAHLFNTDGKLDILERRLLSMSKQYGWQLEAWAVFANHYHFVARGNPNSSNLGVFLQKLHYDSARDLNVLDGVPGRAVWHNFRDTRLTNQYSYLARLHYVHRNPVKHKFVAIANQYPWCSAAWFERTASPAQVKTIYSFKTDRVNVDDEF
jgi:putative transposase